VEWREAPIARHHDRKAFDCGAPALNDYLDRYARQNHESGGAKTFVAVLRARRRRAFSVSTRSAPAPSRSPACRRD
jgi:hypothetical protein